MTSYNLYIGILMTRKEIFFVEFKEIEFFSKYLEVITEIISDFTQEIKGRDIRKTARQGKDIIDNLKKIVYTYNEPPQDSKVSHKIKLKIIGSKQETKIANYIH